VLWLRVGCHPKYIATCFRVATVPRANQTVTDAMRFWSDTATAVAVRRNDEDACEVAAPFGEDDLLGLILRPTPRFAGENATLRATPTDKAVGRVMASAEADRDAYATVASQPYPALTGPSHS
jgi:hypothetical protein